jgi:hypothetical protein
MLEFFNKPVKVSPIKVELSRKVIYRRRMQMAGVRTSNP